MNSHQGLATGGMSDHSGLPDKGVCVCVCVCVCMHSKMEREFTGGMSGHSGLPDKGVCVCVHAQQDGQGILEAGQAIGTCYFLAQISVFLSIKWGHLPCNGCK